MNAQELTRHDEVLLLVAHLADPDHLDVLGGGAEVMCSENHTG